MIALGEEFVGQQNLAPVIGITPATGTDKQSPLSTVVISHGTAHLTRVTHTLLEYFAQSNWLKLGPAVGPNYEF